jgi:ComF family protein
MTIRHSIHLISELIYPSNIYCIACGALIDSTRPYSLCDDCIREIPWNTGRTCAKCGKALSPNTRGDLCHDCKYTNRRFDNGLSCATYAGPVKDMIRGMKYRDMSYAAYKIADAMYDRYIAEGLRTGLRGQSCEADLSPCPAIDTATGELRLPDMIVSVPMNEIKKQKRGYDQAEVIGRALAAKLGVTYKTGLLVRHVETSVMSALSRAERGANTAGAFAIKRGLPQNCCNNKHIMLVDDVYTTGSTADACAAVLKKAGAKAVTICTFATGTDMHITSERNG